MGVSTAPERSMAQDPDLARFDSRFLAPIDLLRLPPHHIFLPSISPVQGIYNL